MFSLSSSIFQWQSSVRLPLLSLKYVFIDRYIIIYTLAIDVLADRSIIMNMWYNYYIQYLKYPVLY